MIYCLLQPPPEHFKDVDEVQSLVPKQHIESDASELDFDVQFTDEDIKQLVS